MASDFIKKLGEVVERERERFKVPGISVGILRDGNVEAGGYGVGSLDTNDAVTSETLFQIGSNSKVFTTTLLMTLVDEGKVNLDAPITDYLPNLKLKDEGALEKMRVRHFVSHQTGLWGDYFEDFGWGDDAITKAVAKAVDMPQMYQPEELWAYTNINFTIVGKLIEDELGQTFEAAMKERVFDPLEMQRSFYFPWEVIVWPHAVGHTPAKPGDKEVEPARNFWLNRQLGPAGAISSNVHDVLAFDKFHLTGQTPTGKPVISDKSRLAMRQPQIVAANFVDEWALGWWLYKVDGAQIIGHGGGTNGFITRNTTIPEKNMAWAIFTNSARGGSAIRNIERWMLAEAAGLTERDPELTTLSKQQIERVVGDYTTISGDISVTAQNGGITLQTKRAALESGEEQTFPPVDLQPVGELEFMATEGDEEGMRIDFIPNADGSIRFVRMGGRVATRV
jgi:CubicO group peptidase (beta-lactamase class C family)